MPRNSKSNTQRKERTQKEERKAKSLYCTLTQKKYNGEVGKGKETICELTEHKSEEDHTGTCVRPKGENKRCVKNRICAYVEKPPLKDGEQRKKKRVNEMTCRKSYGRPGTDSDECTTYEPNKRCRLIKTKSTVAKDVEEMGEYLQGINFLDDITSIPHDNTLTVSQVSLDLGETQFDRIPVWAIFG